MKSIVNFVFALLMLGVLIGETQAQCQRGGQGSQRGAPPQSGSQQRMSCTQSSSTPQAIQQASTRQQLQLAYLRQQAAMQQFRLQQLRYDAQADLEKLAQRRAQAEARRAEVVTKRERSRQQILARLEATRQAKEVTATAFVSVRTD